MELYTKELLPCEDVCKMTVQHVQVVTALVRLQTRSYISINDLPDTMYIFDDIRFVLSLCEVSREMTVRLVLTFLKVIRSANSPLIFPSIKFNFNTVCNLGFQ